MEKIMKKLLLSLLLAAVAVNAFGMQQPAKPSKVYRYAGKALKAVGALGALGISMYYGSLFTYCACLNMQTDKDIAKASPENIMIKPKRIVLDDVYDLYNFELKQKNENETEGEKLGKASVMCRKNGDQACELMMLEVEKHSLRGKGYGSFFLQEVLKYLKSETNAPTVGLIATPMDPCMSQSTLNKFYEKNGARSQSKGSSDFVFNLRDNKI